MWKTLQLTVRPLHPPRRKEAKDHAAEEEEGEEVEVAEEEAVAEAKGIFIIMIHLNSVMNFDY